MNKFVVILGALGLFFYFGFNTSKSEVQVISISGSSTMAPLLAEIGKRYEQNNKGVRVQVQTGGSSKGIADARAGLSDIGASSRQLKDDEKAGLTTKVLARDGVCFLVHAENKVQELSSEQLRAIYKKEITNWKEVGGVDAPIVVVTRADGRSEVEILRQKFELPASEVSADIVAGDNQHGMKILVTNPHAIIYMSVGTAEFDEGQGVPIRRLPLNGVAASSERISQGHYLLRRDLVLVLNEKRKKPEVESFLNYMTSDAVHDLIRDFAFVPQG